MTEERISYLTHKNRKILYLDFKGIELEDVASVLEAAQKVIAENPPKSVRHLTDVTDTNFSKETITQFKQYANHNDPYIYRSAAIGVEGLMKVLFNAVIKFAGRKNLVAKGSMEEALEWLCED